MQTAWLRIPGPALLAQVEPLNGQLWGCEPIEIHEIRAAVAAQELEAQAWDTVKDKLHGPPGRTFHIRRIATFVREGLGELRTHPITIGVDASGDPKVRLYNGNHRIAAAAILRPMTIDALVTWFDQQDVIDLLPGAAQI